MQHNGSLMAAKAASHSFIHMGVAEAPYRRRQSRRRDVADETVTSPRGHSAEVRTDRVERGGPSTRVLAGYSLGGTAGPVPAGERLIADGRAGSLLLLDVQGDECQVGRVVHAHSVEA